MTSYESGMLVLGILTLNITIISIVVNLLLELIKENNEKK